MDWLDCPVSRLRLVPPPTQVWLMHAWHRALLLLLFLFFEEETLHVSQICRRSNISGQLKETSGMKAYTARPTTGEAALRWHAIRV